MSKQSFCMFADDRCIEAARYIIENNATVREAAKVIGVSKSTIHKDVTDILKKRNRAMYLLVREVLDNNKAERHIRGGLATKHKYAPEVPV